MGKDLGFEIELQSGFRAAVSQVKDALKHEGFGILTQIDLQAAFREKLGREFRPYVDDCYFAGCTHIHEPDCAVRAALDTGSIDPARYDSYVKLRAGEG